MSETLAWVVGSGGLLGSHVLASIREQAGEIAAWDPGPAKIPWQEPSSGLRELEDQVERFALEVQLRSCPWALLWCAGAGVVGTSADALAVETRYLTSLLGLLEVRLADRPGKVLLASSAGGVYGGNPEQPLTEASRCEPISDYGRNKLDQEHLLLRWAQGHPEISTLIARISNLYGPGQNIQKPQGLIAHISRSFLHRTPVHVYVSLDTLRDYLFVDDCAKQLIWGLIRLQQAPCEHVLKIFHAGETVTIAAIIAAFGRIAKGHPRIICSAHPARTMQPTRLQFRSTVWTDLPAPPRTDLAVGIQRVHQYQLALFQQGRLPPPRLI